MARSLFDFLCGIEPMAFESDFALHESLRRLTSEVKPPLLRDRPLPTVVVGEVAEEQVRLWCERLHVRNGFRPLFIGRFQIFDKRVILIGTIVGMNGLAPLIVGAGLAMGLFFTVGTSLELIKGSNEPGLWLMPLGGVLPVLFAIGMVHLGRWLSSGDEDWIFAAIRSALVKSTRTTDAR